MRGAGGKDVRPFLANVTVPVEFEWIDREQIKAIDRSRGVTVHWKPGAPGPAMFLVAANVDQITTALGVCLCSVKPDDSQFTIPAAMLANIPASQDVAGVPYDELVLGSIRVDPAMNAGGLTRGFLITALTVGRFVVYR